LALRLLLTVPGHFLIMRGRLLERIAAFEAGKSAVGYANTDFPEELFQDHFPSFPVTPGILLVEMCAQLAGRLVEVSGANLHQTLVFPVLTMICDAKFRQFVPPRSRLLIKTQLEHIRRESAICKASVSSNNCLHANMRLMFAFDPDGLQDDRPRAELENFERSEFLRLGLQGFPPGPVTVAAHACS
jgi:3-hydroxyacyl-[acyl-carrier-protein] dehydratase